MTPSNRNPYNNRYIWLLIFAVFAALFAAFAGVIPKTKPPVSSYDLSEHIDTTSFTIEAAGHNMYIVDGRAGTVAYKEKGSTWIIKDSAAALKVLLDCLEMEQKNLILRRYERGQMAKY